MTNTTETTNTANVTNNAGTDRFVFMEANSDMRDEAINAMENLTKEQLLDKVLPRLISKEYGDALKENSPSIILGEYMNMYIKYAVALSSNDEGSLVVTINKNLLDTYGISETDLREFAFNNLKSIPLYIESMNNILSRIIGMPYDETDKYLLLESEMLPDLTKGLYVVTNEDNFFGANVLMEIPLLTKIADALDADLYIIPSSVHEVIIVPSDIIDDVSELNPMIGSVNENEVVPKEQLGDKAYCFKRSDMTLSIVD